VTARIDVGAVFSELKVSLACCVDEDKTVWSITRESGRVPTPCGDFNCRVCAVRSTAVVLAQGYLVIKAVGPNRGEGVTMSLLTLDALEVAVRYLVNEVEGLRWGSAARWVSRRARLFCLLEQGLYSCGPWCGCSGQSGVCGSCAAVVPPQRRFTWRDRYDGVYPLGEQHWFRGVSDAVGTVCNGELPWLFCWQSVA
jgi:hypothetical protein